MIKIKLEWRTKSHGSQVPSRLIAHATSHGGVIVTACFSYPVLPLYCELCTLMVMQKHLVKQGDTTRWALFTGTKSFKGAVPGLK